MCNRLAAVGLGPLLGGAVTAVDALKDGTCMLDASLGLDVRTVLVCRLVRKVLACAFGLPAVFALHCSLERSVRTVRAEHQ